MESKVKRWIQRSGEEEEKLIYDLGINKWTKINTTGKKGSRVRFDRNGMKID